MKGEYEFKKALKRFKALLYSDDSDVVLQDVVEDIESLEGSDETLRVVAEAFNDAMDRRNV